MPGKELSDYHSPDQDRLTADCLDSMQKYLWTRNRDFLDKANQKHFEATLLNVKCQVETLCLNDEPSLFIICAKPDSPPKFGTCFPLMPGKEWLNDLPDQWKKGYESNTFYLRDLSLENPLWVYIYSSNGSIQKVNTHLQGMSLWKLRFNGSGPSLEAKTGLYMFGNLPVSDGTPVITELAEFAGIKWPNPLIKATVYYPDAFPVLRLQMPLKEELTFSEKCKLADVAVVMSSPLYFSPKCSQVGLKAALKLNDKKEIKFEGDWPIEGDLITASVKYQDEQLPFVDAGTLPGSPAFPPNTELDLEMEFSKSQKQLKKVSFSADLEEWVILKDILTLKKIRFEFSIYDPFGTKIVIASIAARAAFGKAEQIELTCSGFYPGGQLSLRLETGIKPDQQLKINKLIGDLSGTSTDSPSLSEDYVVSDLSLEYNLNNNYFSALVDVSGEWKIVENFVLKDLCFRINKTESYRFYAGTAFAIAGVDVRLAAQYVSEKESKYWEFSGSTGPGQEIPIGELLKALGESITKTKITLPEPLEGLKIENIGISFDTGNKDFKFTCESKFPVSDTEVDIVVAIDLTHKDGSYEHKFGGTITIGEYQFALIFSEDEKSQLLLAAYHHEGGALAVKSLINCISKDIAGLIPEGLSVNVKEALFAYAKKEKKSKWLFGIDLDIGANLDFSGLPLVGDVIPKDQSIGVNNLKFLATSEPFNKQELEAANKVIPKHVSKLPASDEAGLGKGFLLAVRLQLGQTAEEIILGTALSAKEKSEALKSITPAKALVSTMTEPPTPEAAGRPPLGNTKWLNVQKSFGPVSFKRVGLQYRDERVWFLLDAALSAAGLTISLDGLAVGSKLVKFSLEFNIDGLGLDYKNGPVQISGSLLKVSDLPEGVSLQYDGSVIVRAEAFTLSALGSYAVMKTGETSLFVFAVLQKELGGPAFFFVTGLALGFGFNRTLKLPPIEELQNYPLIKGATDPAYFGSRNDAGTALKKLNDYISPSVGDCWLAAGVKFTSFGMIDSFAMLSVSFGMQFQIALLGLSKITIPKQVPGAPPMNPVACAELAIKVTFTPASGLLAAEARLTDNSYVFSKKCRLTGGFAFYCWFAYEHEGDFVVTLGGYHPKFKRPDHYPIIPRLAISWPISSNLHVLGEAYFALTPSCLMAGGRLEAVYQSGDLRAWFCAFADFLISWKPFYYDIAIGVTIGASYRLSFLGIRKTFTIELGAAVHLWGPPFGGRARITWYIISFTISFGQKRIETPPVLEWDEFNKSFLPQPEEGSVTFDPLVSTIRITSGLTFEKEIEGKKDKLSVVNAHELSMTTESLIPSTCVLVNNNKIKQEDKNPYLGIRPMGKTTLDSTHNVTFKRVPEVQEGDKDVSKEDWQYLQSSLVRKNVPYALWSNDLKRLDSPSADTIKDVACGVTVSLNNREPTHKLPAIDIEKFAYEDIPKPIPWIEVPLPEIIPAPGDNTLMNTIWNNSDVDRRRNKILNALALVKGETFYNSVNVPDLATNAREIFQSEPEMAVLGQKRKS